jgi:hypothetical protein
MSAEAITQAPAQTVTGAIYRASKLTGASFRYLLATAQVESNLNPNARVSTTSARGLFQFIEQTWLSTLKDSGRALGYGRYSDAIVRTRSGRMTVPDADMRRTILNLRQDPAANAAMAGAFTQANALKLSSRLGREPTEGELYMAHFLGPGGAARLISAAEASPQSSAAALFPQAARANASIFFDRKGGARSLAQVSDVLANKYDVARLRAPVRAALVEGNASSSAIGAADPNRIPELRRGITQDTDAVSSAPSESFGHRLLTLAAAIAGTLPAGAPQPTEPASNTQIARRHTGASQAVASTGRIGPPPRLASAFSAERSGALAPMVRDLWDVSSTTRPLGAGTTLAAAPGGGQGVLDLFRDTPAHARELFAKA